MCVGSWEWYCIRMDLASVVVIGTACAFCILNRSDVEPVLLALMLRYIVTLQQYSVWSLNQFGQIEQLLVSVQRFLNLEYIEQEKDTHELIPTSNWPEKGRVEFKDIVLRYRPTTEPVLKNLSFEIEPGTKVGVVGRTGAGKSTICISMSRIVELFEGSVEIDGIDISKIDL